MILVKNSPKLVAAILSSTLWTVPAFGEHPISVPWQRGGAVLTRAEDFATPPPPPCPQDFQSGYADPGGRQGLHDVSYNPRGYCGGEMDCAGNQARHYHYVTECGPENWNRTTGCNIASCHVEVYEHREEHSSFALTTKIMMGDKTYRAAAKIQKGDMLWNPTLNKAVRARKVVIGFEPEALFDLVFEGSTLRVSQQHPMVIDRGAGSTEIADTGAHLVRTSLREETATARTLPFGNYTVHQARALKVGDMVLAADGKLHKLLEIKTLPIKPDQKVVNIELEGDDSSLSNHMLLSEGLITGDYSIQLQVNKLK